MAYRVVIQNSFNFRAEEKITFAQTLFYDWNPFVTRKEQIEKSHNYKDVVTKWEKDAQGHVVTKVGRVVAETGGTVLGHMLEHVSGLPSGAPEILGTLSGLATSELVEPTVKVFTKPEMERQREYAIEALNVLGYGGPVEQACRRIDEKVNQGYFI